MLVDVPQIGKANHVTSVLVKDQIFTHVHFIEQEYGALLSVLTSTKSGYLCEHLINLISS